MTIEGSKAAEGLTQEMAINTGVRQGDAMSATLFYISV